VRKGGTGDHMYNKTQPRQSMKALNKASGYATSVSSILPYRICVVLISAADLYQEIITIINRHRRWPRHDLRSLAVLRTHHRQPDVDVCTRRGLDNLGDALMVPMCRHLESSPSSAPDNAFHHRQCHLPRCAI